GAIVAIVVAAGSLRKAWVGGTRHGADAAIRPRHWRDVSGLRAFPGRNGRRLVHGTGGVFQAARFGADRHAIWIHLVAETAETLAGRIPHLVKRNDDAVQRRHNRRAVVAGFA